MTLNEMTSFKEKYGRGSDFGEEVWFSYQITEKFSSLAKPEQVWRFWVNNRQPQNRIRLHTQAVFGLAEKEGTWYVTLCLTGAVCRQCRGFGFHTEKTTEKRSPGRGCQVIERAYSDPQLEQAPLHELLCSLSTPSHLFLLQCPSSTLCKEILTSRSL